MDSDVPPITDEGPTILRMSMRRPARQGTHELRALAELADDLTEAGYSVTITGDLSLVCTWDVPDPPAQVRTDVHLGDPT